MRYLMMFGLAAVVIFTPLAGQNGPQTDLESMRILAPTKEPRGRINAVDATWEAWQKRTGELPPDFSKMRSIPFAPDPLEGVRTREQWAARRIELKKQVEQWITGHMPPAPGNLRAVVTGASLVWSPAAKQLCHT